MYRSIGKYGGWELYYNAPYFYLEHDEMELFFGFLDLKDLKAFVTFLDIAVGILEMENESD